MILFYSRCRRRHRRHFTLYTKFCDDDEAMGCFAWRRMGSRLQKNECRHRSALLLFYNLWLYVAGDDSESGGCELQASQTLLLNSLSVCVVECGNCARRNSCCAKVIVFGVEFCESNIYLKSQQAVSYKYMLNSLALGKIFSGAKLS